MATYDNPNHQPLIFISNDDGIAAKGLDELIRFLRPLGELVVMAPDSPRSGSACALTVIHPVHYSQVHKEEGLTVYRCTGTPVECVKLARYTILDREPDLVVGGINHGDNSATNVHFSGTMGVVIEGCLAGIPSIGYSLCDHGLNANFDATGPYIQRITQAVLEFGLPPLVCLNVNFPNTQNIKGIRVCSQAKGRWEHEWEHCPNSRDSRYFWLSGEFVDKDPTNKNSDHWALAHGYAAITPTTVDVTAYHMIGRIQQWFEE